MAPDFAEGHFGLNFIMPISIGFHLIGAIIVHDLHFTQRRANSRSA